MIIFWLAVWLLSGVFSGHVPTVEPWNEWFAFLLACVAGSFCGAIRANRLVLVPVNNAHAEQDEAED